MLKKYLFSIVICLCLYSRLYTKDKQEGPVIVHEEHERFEPTIKAFLIAVLAQHPAPDLEEKISKDLQKLVLIARSLVSEFKDLAFSESAARIIDRNRMLFEAILIVAKCRNKEREGSERLECVAEKERQRYLRLYRHLIIGGGLYTDINLNEIQRLDRITIKNKYISFIRPKATLLGTENINP